MSRRNPFRELENDLEDLEAATDDVADEGPMIAFRDAGTGEVKTADGDPLDPEGPDPLVVIEHSLVMERSRAEEQGIEILGPAEDVPNDRDIVKVPPDAYREVDDREWATE